MKYFCSFLASAIFSISLLQSAIADESDSQITCDYFEIDFSVEESRLTLSLDTDLPDFTDVIVSVSRSYFETGNSAEYSLDYFEEKATVGKWRTPRQIRLSGEKWKKELAASQRRAAAAGVGFDVGKISDEIEIRATVPAIQSDDRFGGPGNPNLSGQGVVKRGKARLVKASATFARSLDDSEVKKQRWASHDALVAGQAYRLSKKTPLMPEPNPSDPISALRQVKEIESDQIIAVVKIIEQDGQPWYQVEVMNRDGMVVETGWVNSLALIGQELEVISEP